MRHRIKKGINYIRGSNVTVVYTASETALILDSSGHEISQPDWALIKSVTRTWERRHATT